MKHISVYESFKEEDRYDTFIKYIDALPDSAKHELSDLWAGPSGEPSPDPITATLGSAVWATLSIGGGRGFKERAVKYLMRAGSSNPQRDLDDFVASYGM